MDHDRLWQGEGVWTWKEAGPSNLLLVPGSSGKKVCYLIISLIVGVLMSILWVGLRISLSNSCSANLCVSASPFVKLGLGASWRIDGDSGGGHGGGDDDGSGDRSDDVDVGDDGNGCGDGGGSDSSGVDGGGGDRSDDVGGSDDGNGRGNGGSDSGVDGGSGDGGIDSGVGVGKWSLSSLNTCIQSPCAKSF